MKPTYWFPYTALVGEQTFVLDIGPFLWQADAQAVHDQLIALGEQVTLLGVQAPTGWEIGEVVQR